MCSIIVINHHYKHFPLVIAANREEAISRKTSPIQAISTDPLIFGAKDERKGGSHFAVNQHSLFAAITNQGTKNPKLLSRGLIIKDILKCSSLDEMISFVEELNPAPYNKFNLVFGNQKTLFVAHSYILHSMVINEIPNGVNLITDDMKFNVQTDDKRALVHMVLDTEKETLWPEYYKSLKSVLADQETKMLIKPRKSKVGKLSGKCTRSSDILAFDDSGLVRFKHYDRTAPKEEGKKTIRYKDHIDEFRELSGQKKLEGQNEEAADDEEQKTIQTIADEAIKAFENYVAISSIDDIWRGV